MKHGRKDYQRIQDPMNKIPENEPVFLLRGQDIYAVQTLIYYYNLFKGSGGEDRQKRAYLLDALEHHIQIIRQWQIDHKTKSADYNENVISEITAYTSSMTEDSERVAVLNAKIELLEESIVRHMMNFEKSIADLDKTNVQNNLLSSKNVVLSIENQKLRVQIENATKSFIKEANDSIEKETKNNEAPASHFD